MTIRPHNSHNPVPIDDPCYRCEGRWKIMILTKEDNDDLIARGCRGVVVKCSGCGIVSMATRVEAEPSRV